jgi:hypothetical protein
MSTLLLEDSREVRQLVRDLGMARADDSDSTADAVSNESFGAGCVASGQTARAEAAKKDGYLIPVGRRLRLEDGVRTFKQQLGFTGTALLEDGDGHHGEISGDERMTWAVCTLTSRNGLTSVGFGGHGQAACKGETGQVVVQGGNALVVATAHLRQRLAVQLFGVVVPAKFLAQDPQRDEGGQMQRSHHTGAGGLIAALKDGS